MTRNIIFSIILLAAGVSTVWGEEVFDHRAHLEEYIPGTSCDTCHVAKAKAIVPEKSVCLQCHEQPFIDGVSLPTPKTHGPVWALNHRSEAKAKAIDCSSCHEQKFCLDCHKAGFADEMGSFSNNMINVHRSDFQVSHPIAARTNPQLCASCHENGFCEECHNDFRRTDLAGVSHRRQWSDMLAGGAPHENVDPNSCRSCHIGGILPSHEWTNGHAREARKNLATCQACHPDGQVCIKCHSAKSGLMANPHPGDWNNFKNRIRDTSNLKSCLPCHDPDDPALK